MSRKTRVIVATGIATAIIAVTMSAAGVSSVSEASRTTAAIASGGQSAALDDSKAAAVIQRTVTRAIDYRNHWIVAGSAPATVEIVSEYFIPEAVPGVLQDSRLIEDRRERLVPFGVVYTASQSDIVFQEIVLRNGTATARVKEKTTLSYAPVNGIQGPDEVYVYEQQFELSESGAVWKISGSRPMNPVGMGPSTVIDPRSRTELSSRAAQEPSPAAPGPSRGARVYRDANGSPAPLPSELQNPKNLGPSGEPKK